jgi:hypothetical protein
MVGRGSIGSRYHHTYIHSVLRTGSAIFKNTPRVLIWVPGKPYPHIFLHPPCVLWFHAYRIQSPFGVHTFPP